MKEYKNNPRLITTTQYGDLTKSLKRLGDISGIVHDVETDEIICGNQRMAAIGFDDTCIRIVKKYETIQPDKTIAIGFIEKDDIVLNYRAVIFTESERAIASLSANKMGGTFDESKFKCFDSDVIDELGFKQDVQMEHIVESKKRAAETVTVSLGQFQFHITLQEFERYVERLQGEQGEGEGEDLITLFLKDIGYYEGV